MTEPHSRPEPRAPRWLKWVNPINRFLLKRGIGPPPQHLLTTIGRNSGRLRSTPVAVLTFEGGRYLVAGFSGSDWVKNARAAGRGYLQRGRNRESVALVEVPLEQRAAILQLFAQRVRGGQSFLTVPAKAPLAAFAAAAPQHPIFRLIEMDAADTSIRGMNRT
jgi:deazaflavin-dependent oxidoreductase (nitroreductase family)